MSKPGRKLSLGGWVWVLVAVLAAFELLAHPWIRASIPSDEDWSDAADFVRARFETNDRVVAAPAWADPIVRRHLGDLMSLRAAAPPDLAGIDRVWELAVRGAKSRQEAPETERDFGGVRVRAWKIDGPQLLYDFVENIHEARVEIDTDRGPLACPWREARPGQGGLERGPMRPSQRFVCDSKRPWLWVGPTVLADLELEPRRCIWQHPTGRTPLRTTFDEVPLGEHLVVHAGIDYQVARQRNYTPVTLTVRIDGELAGELVHHDGDGWTELRIDTGGRAGEHVTIDFETTTPRAAARLFCYSASIQAGGTHE